MSAMDASATDAMDGIGAIDAMDMNATGTIDAMAMNAIGAMDTIAMDAWPPWALVMPWL